MHKTAMRWVLGLALVLVIAFALVLAIAFALAWRDRFDAAALQAGVEGAGAAGPALFLPGAVLTLAGGTPQQAAGCGSVRHAWC